MLLDYHRHGNDRKVFKIHRLVWRNVKLSLSLQGLTSTRVRGLKLLLFSRHWMDERILFLLSAFQITAHSKKCSETPSGFSTTILMTAHYGLSWMAWAYASPRLGYCVFANASRWMLWSADTFADAALTRRWNLLGCKMKSCEVVWRPQLVSTKLTARLWPIDESVTLLPRWWWVCNVLKLCFTMTSLAYRARRMRMLGLWSPSSSCHRTSFATEKLYNPAQQDEAEQRANRLPLVRHCLSATSPAWRSGLKFVWTSRPEYCTHEASNSVCRNLEKLQRSEK